MADIVLELDEQLSAADRALVERAELAALAQAILESEGSEDAAGVTVLLAGPELLRELNREHREIDEATDVLSFPASEGEAFPAAPGEPRYLGDIAISVATVRENALLVSLAPELELRHVVVHGLLHLLGYDHETSEDDAAMRAREESVLGPEIHARRGDEAHSDRD